MTFAKSPIVAKSVAAGLLVLAGSAQAHTGHGTSSLMSGMVHPLGMDHMLAMLAVGLWSVRALPAQRAWQGPALFMLALVTGAALGALGFQFAMLEQLIALSVVLFGVMLMMSVRRLPIVLGLVAVALSALAHGMAHGAEAPAGGLAAYAVGFLGTTALLHFGGVAAGLGLRKFFARNATAVVASLGSILGLTGVYLLNQV
ncbi:MAG: HupE/UreJ family protein [Burkholderiales bacterium]|nr:HupE/UreJ family protein [Burkholderiales bacterium]